MLKESWPTRAWDCTAAHFGGRYLLTVVRCCCEAFEKVTGRGCLRFLSPMCLLAAVFGIVVFHEGGRLRFPGMAV